MEATKEALWIQHILTELGIDQKYPTKLRCDINQSTIHLAYNSMYHSKTEHIDLGTDGKWKLTDLKSSSSGWNANQNILLQASSTILLPQSTFCKLVFPQLNFHNWYLHIILSAIVGCGMWVCNSQIQKMDFCNYAATTVLSTLVLRIMDYPFHFSKGWIPQFSFRTSFSATLLSRRSFAGSFLTIDLRSDAGLTLTLWIFTFLLRKLTTPFNLLNFTDSLLRPITTELIHGMINSLCGNASTLLGILQCLTRPSNYTHIELKIMFLVIERRHQIYEHTCRDF